MARCGHCGTSLENGALSCSLCGGTAIPSRGERGLQPLFSVGDVLSARFKVERILGSGASGVVYGVHDAHTERRVALKILWEQASEGDAALQRMKREIRTAQGAPNPHCVAVYDLIFIQGHPAILMEWVEGETLRDKVRRDGALPWEEAATLAGQVLQAMAHLHAVGVVHRDIKSGNVMLAADGTAKLGDFGLAKGEAVGATLTETGMALGTPGYMAPEVIRGGPATPASDLYSLGVMLFEMLTGRMPFQGSSALEVASRQISEPPPLHLLREKKIPRWLGALSARLLERDPADRFPSAKAALSALEARRRGLWLNHRARLRVAAATGVVLLAAGGIAGLDWWRAHSLPTLAADGAVLTAKGPFGETLFKRTFDQPIQNACAGRFGPGGSPAVACALAWDGASPSDDGRVLDERRGGSLLFLDRRGETLASTRLKIPNSPFAPRFKVTLSTHRFARGEPERLVVYLHHMLWYPASLQVFSALSATRGGNHAWEPVPSTFYSSGHLSQDWAYADLDGDGLDEIVFGGVNNRLYKTYVVGAMAVGRAAMSDPKSASSPDLIQENTPFLYRLLTFAGRIPSAGWLPASRTLHLSQPNGGPATDLTPGGVPLRGGPPTEEVHALNAWVSGLCRLRDSGEYEDLVAKIHGDTRPLPAPYDWLRRLFHAHGLIGSGRYQEAVDLLLGGSPPGSMDRPFAAYQLYFSALFLSGRYKECVTAYMALPASVHNDWADLTVPVAWANAYAGDSTLADAIRNSPGFHNYPMPEFPALLAALSGDSGRAEELARGLVPDKSLFPEPSLVLIHALLMQGKTADARAVMDTLKRRFAGERLDDGETELWLRWHERPNVPGLLGSMDRLVEEKRRRAVAEMDIRALLPLTLARAARMHRDAGDAAGSKKLQSDAYRLAPKGWRAGLTF